MEPEGNDNLDSLRSLIGDNHLFRTWFYDLHRKDGWIRIVVRECLYGSLKGTFQAQPHFQYSSRSAEFIGKGTSLKQALTECLKNIKGVHVQRQVPDHDDSDPDWSNF